MTGKILSLLLVLSTFFANAQKLLLMDRFNGNKVVNDSTLTVYSTDPEIVDLTIYFTMKNNTDHPLALFLRKHINYIADSTIDYFCFGVSCWPDTDTTNIADTVKPGAEDMTFASHVVHFRRFESPPLPAGKSSITYTIYDTTATDPVQASVTVIYHLSGVGIEENNVHTAMVYPNPVINEIRIPIDDKVTKVYNLKLYNTSGIMVKQDMVTINNGLLTYPISGLGNGYYFGKLITGNGPPVSFKFVYTSQQVF